MLELVFGLPALYGAGMTWFLIRLNRKRLQDWEKAARSCGLRIEESSKPWAWRLWLKARGEPLGVRTQDSRRKVSRCEIVIEFPRPPASSGVRIRAEESKPPGAHEIEI